MSPPGGPLCPPVLLALLLGLPQSSGSLQCQDQAVSTAGSLCLVPEKPPWEWTEVDWRVQNDEGRRERILTASRDGSVSYSKHRFHGRANFQQETLSLCLSPVLKEDSGVYIAEFENPTGALTPQCFRVSVWASTSDAPEVIGAAGGSVTFRSQIPAADVAFWNFKGDSIATVLTGGHPQVLFADKKYRTRFTFSENGLVLTISQLSLEDAGIYSVKIEGRTSSFTLRVYRELLEPTVTCEAQNCSAGSCFFSLRCSVPGAGFGNVSYFWSSGEQMWDEGPTVLVENKSSGSDPESLTCTAQNPVSSRNVTVPNPGGLCAENAAHSPGPDPNPGSLVRVVAVAVGEAAVLSSIFLGFYCKDQWEARLSSSRG